MADQKAPAAGMTVNTFGSSTYSTPVLRVIIERMEQEAQYSAYFERFTGEVDKFNRAPDNIVVRKSDLERGGDSLIIPMKTNIALSKVFGDAELLGNEVSQELYNLEIKINQWRAAVSGPKRNANHRIKFLRMIQEMKPDLVRATSRELDADHFRALNEGYSENLTTTTDSEGLGITMRYHRKIYGVGESSAITNGSATSIAAWVAPTTGTICSNDILDLDSIDAIKALGKTDKIVPLNLAGGGWWALLNHQNVIYNIQTANSNAWRAGVQYAAERGRDNPFFTGALWAYNGIAIHEHPDCPSVTASLGATPDTITFSYKDDNTDNIKCSYLLGRHAIGYAMGSNMEFNPELYDYRNVRSLGMAMINGLARFDFVKDDGNDATFISQGSAMILSYAANPTL